MVNFKPIGNKVLIEVEKAQEKVGSLFIREAAQDKPQIGLVIAAGKGGLDKNGNFVKMELEGGERVLFNKYGGVEIKLENKGYLILNEIDVIGILD